MEEVPVSPQQASKLSDGTIANSEALKDRHCLIPMTVFTAATPATATAARQEERSAQTLLIELLPPQSVLTRKKTNL